MDMQGNILYCNDRKAQIFGYSAGELEGKNAFALIAPESIANVQAEIEHLLTQGYSDNFEAQVIRKNGGIFWAGFNITLIRDENGNPFQIMDVVRNITVQKEIDDTNKENLIRHKQMFELNVLAKIILDPESGAIVDANQAACQFYQYEKSELCAKKVSDIEISGPEELKARYAAAAGLSLKQYSAEHLLADGSKPWVRISFSPMKLSGKIYLEAIIQDITELHKATAAKQRAAKLLDSVLENIPFGVAVIAASGHIVSTNATLKNLFDLDQNENLHGMEIDTAWKLFPARFRDDAKVRARMDQIMANHIATGPFDVNLTDNRILQMRYFPLKANDELNHLLIFEDVTVRKLNQQSLIEMERMYRSVVEKSPMPIGIHADGKIQLINPAAAKLLGYEDPRELIGKDIVSIIHPENRKEVMQRVAKIIGDDKAKAGSMEQKWVRKDGSEIFVEVIAEHIEFAGRPASEVLFRDISERKRLERIQETMRIISGAMLTTKDSASFYQEIDRQVSGLFETSNFSILLYHEQKDELELVYMRDQKDFQTSIPARQTLSSLVIGKNKSKLFTEKQMLRLNKVGLTRQVGTRSKIWMGVPLRSAGKTIGAVVVQDYERENVYNHKDMQLLEFVADEIGAMIQQKKNEDRILKLSQSVEQSPACVMLADLNGKIEYINPRFKSLMGFTLEELNISERSKKLLIFDYLSEIIELIHTGKIWTKELQVSSKDDRKFWVAVTVNGIRNEHDELQGLLMIGEDITERKKLQDQLFQVQKMESIGTLTGGIAHDFNNILTIINGYCELTLDDLPKTNPVRENIEYIFSAATKAQGLVSNLMAYSKKQKINPKRIYLEDTIREFEPVLRKGVGEQVQLKYHFESKPHMIEADPVQLEQVLVNLAVNGRDAILLAGAEADSKEIHITVSDYTDQEKYGNRNFARISVSDHGTGIDDVTGQKIFEPFFTTKNKATHSGLGLATVYGIVQQNQAEISVDSKPGTGTTINIDWPLVAPKHDGDAPAIPEEAGKEPKKVVLLAEDDDDIRKFTVSILRKLGYTVLQAMNGKEALDVLAEYQGVVDVFVLDVVMPVMNGYELAEELRRRGYRPRVLFTSGYAENYTRPPQNFGEIKLLAKPYTISQLTDRLRTILMTGEKNNN